MMITKRSNAMPAEDETARARQLLKDHDFRQQLLKNLEDRQALLNLAKGEGHKPPVLAAVLRLAVLALLTAAWGWAMAEADSTYLVVISIFILMQLRDFMDLLGLTANRRMDALVQLLESQGALAVGPSGGADASKAG